MNYPKKSSACIAIIIATQWEAKGVIQKVGMKEKCPNLFELSNPSLSVVMKICGIGRERAKKVTEEILSYSPNLILSTGFCGAVQKELRSGDLIIDEGRSDSEVVLQLVNFANKNRIRFFKGRISTVERSLMNQEEKIEWGLKNNVLAVEMESDAIAELCQKHQIPFCSFRTVSDEADQNLPSIISSFDLDGKIRVRFLRKLIFHPFDWIPLVCLAMSSKKAEKNLTLILSEFIEQKLRGEKDEK